ncbi:O-antigen ligase family protein [Aquimarina brevivitae]|uniref:O-antigen ligase n=1 Tax=Aquimarina brevivitae TaxID=323412 RepID=A0A4Q7PHL0_9FLAO|nr:O-antigen ligase family protein [Aquimarina brevivitae]RZS99280.1 O-antigen ligase [Aquimarina brevivitae]
MIAWFTKYYDRFFYYLLCALATFPVLPRGIQSALVIIIGVISAIYFGVDGRKRWNSVKTKKLISLSSLVLIYLIGLCYVKEYSLAFKYITRSLPILLLAFANLNFGLLDTKKLQIILKLYIAALLLFLTYLHLYYWNDLYVLQLSFWEVRDKIELHTKVHGTYLSMWIGMAVIALCWLGFKSAKSLKNIVILLITIAFLMYWQRMLEARMPLFATILATLYLILRSLKLSHTMIVTFGIGAFLVAGFLVKDKIIAKINELGDHEKAIPAGKYEVTNPLISNENIRSVIYYCALQNIKERPFLGYGIGQDNLQLQQCYDTEFKHTDLFTRFSFNAHSQYLQLILSNGIVGLMLFLFAILSWIIWSKEATLLYLPFLILCVLCFSFENILNRHDGILFFSFFNAILLLTNRKSSNSDQ